MILTLQNPDSSLCVMVYCIQENEQIYMAQISTALGKVQDRDRKRTLVMIGSLETHFLCEEFQSQTIDMRRLRIWLEKGICQT